MPSNDLGEARKTISVGSCTEKPSPCAMISASQDSVRFSLGPLLRGEAVVIAGWITRWTAGHTLRQVALIAAGAGAFGAAMGSWRAPEQAAYAAVKLPLILLGTAAGNALLNGLLAPLLGLNLRLREAFAAVLMSFALAAAILGAFSPLMAFLVWNLPPPVAGMQVSAAAHSGLLLTLVGLIAFAGVTANVRLFQLLRRLAGGTTGPAARLLFAWLAVNLLLGSQLSWVARPFIGKAGVPVVFLTDEAFQGSFFEELARATGELWAHFFP
jgi:hypothetical protein